MSIAGKAQIAIVGGGRMGCGIAFVFALGGYEVSICEVDSKQRIAIPQTITDICELLEINEHNLAPVNVHKDIDSAIPETSVMVIECATENLAIKQSIFSDLEKLTSPKTILTTNTSAIPISDVARGITHKERVIGTHFWNPPQLIELVEVIIGDQSNPIHADKAMEILSGVGMTPVLVKKDVPGCVGNRLQHALKREAIAIVADGICDARTLDIIVKLGFGARLPIMGPLEQSDLLGLNLTVAIHEIIMPALDVTPEVHPYLRKKIAAGETGAEVGKGFRDWTAEEAEQARNRMDEFLVRAAKDRYEQRKGN